jgi:VWFA-related protein
VASLAGGAAILGATASTVAPRVIRVDVIASDTRGRGVDNLKTSDFQILENGASQTIEDLRFVKIDAAAPDDELPPVRSEFDEQAEASRPGARLFAIYLDEYHVSAGEATDRARAALLRFVDRELGPRDLVAVLKPLDSLLTIRATRDREAIRHAIETFEGRKGLYEPRNAFEQNYIAGAPGRIEQVRSQVSTSALNALVIHVGRLNDARKAVLFVSEGVQPPSRRRGMEGLPTIDSIVRSASRYNVSIYTANPRPVDADREDGAADGVLRALAEGTDGAAALEPSAIERATRQMISDSSRYYLLTYRSSQPDDGKFREVQVRVSRPGVQLRARKGYWGLWPDEALAARMLAKLDNPSPPPLPSAFSLPWRTSPLIRPWFGVSRAEGGKTRVTFVWEPAPRVPGDRSRTPPPSRIVLTAMAGDGTTLFEGPVTSGASAAGDAAADRRARAVFDTPPGRVRLRMAIQDGSEQEIDSDVREISVRDLAAPVALGSAEIIRARTARDVRQIDDDPLAVPVAAREFSRAERLIVRFPAYAPDGRPRVAVRLMNRLGQAMRDLPVTGPAAAGHFQVDVTLANLAPGEYFLELSASSPAGEAKDLLGFRVTN